MRLGGLFSGVGGFELAWTQLGHEVAWMCEVDKKARLVLKERFPGITIYEDVRDINPDEVAAVDVLTGGSPCQGFSIAGHRTGMQHSQSGLFEEYVRIMDGLAARGLQYAIWENVPGVLSIKNPNGERTFKHVIGALAGADEPAPLNERAKWNAGMVAGQDRTVAWRVLDSQHFGVAQRRRRVFACVAFGDSATDRAGRTLLAVAGSMRGDSAEGSKARQASAGSFAEGAGGTLEAERGIVTAITSSMKNGPDDSAAQGGHVFVDTPAQSFNWQSGGDARGLNLSDKPSALTANQTPAVLVTMREGKDGGGKGPLISEKKSLTLATNNWQTLFQPKPPKYGVRRLTPTECERLQGFPDGWTDVPGMSDTARYKAMGNAVTVNTVRWILGRLPDVS